MKPTTGRLLAFATSMLLVGAACTDDPGVTPGENNNDPRPGLNNPTIDPPENSTLEHVDPCSAASPICSDSLTFGSGRPLRVLLRDGDGNPVENTSVRFEIESSDAEGSRLTAANSGTNGEGIAETSLTVGNDAGSVEVLVSTADANVTPIRFVIAVSPKGQSSYNVEFTKIGTSDPEKIKVFFYEDSVTCADFQRDIDAQRDDDPTTNPALTAEYSKDGTTLGDGTLPIVQLEAVANGTAYTVGAQAYDRSNPDVEVAVGCVDGNPPVENGSPVTVTVPLIKNLPYVLGEYNVVHEFDLISGLPQNIQNIVNLLGYAISSPGTFIVGCESTGANDEACPVSTSGLIDLVIDFLPDDGLLGDLKDAIEAATANGFVRDTIRNTINSAVDDFINNNANVPSWIKDTRTITQDILNTLQKFEVVGVIKIKQQPVWATDAAGVPSANPDGTLTALWNFDPANIETEYNEQRWDNISFFWRRGCDANSPPECGKRTVGATSLGTTDDLVKGYFDGFLIDGTTLHINQHTLDLNYGLLLLTVVERVVLPEIFGAGVDSLETMFGQIVDCTTISDQQFLQNLCTQALQQGADALREYVTEELTAQGDDNFLISTPEGEGCELLLSEDYVGEWPGKPLPYVDRMGADEPATARCEWSVVVKFGSDTQTTINGKFNGTRD
jgi:hypothetical protein